MSKPSPVFVIPTYRLRDVAATVEAYDDHFRRNGHVLDLVVFDDSSSANQQKYYPLLEQTRTHNPLYYVGPKQKEQFLDYLFGRLRDRKLEPLIRNLFHPSYGGNRNYTLMYTLGNFMVSADDDMRPVALMEDSPETLGNNEVCRGKLMRAGSGAFTEKSYEILTAFLDILGKPVRDIPANHERENALCLQAGTVPDTDTVKMAQTYRSGTNDIDALDFVEMFLGDPTQVSLDDLNELYVLVNFRPPVTKQNWRMDCGVAAYDNEFGLPPFFPTRLRFEDYIYRLWIQQDGLASAHVDAAQNHIKNNYMRNPLPAEVFNEEVANLLKRKIKDSATHRDELSIMFDYDGEVTTDDSENILERISGLHRRVVTAQTDAGPERRQALQSFAISLDRSFYGFEPDFFQQNLVRITDDVISQFKGSLELWPALVEICYLRKHRVGLPRQRVHNHARGSV